MGDHRRMPLCIAVAPCFTLRDAEHDDSHVVLGVASLPHMTSVVVAVPDSTWVLFQVCALMRCCAGCRKAHES